MTRVSFHPQCRVSSSPSWHLLLRGTGLPHSVATATHSAKFPFRMCSNSRPSCTSTSPPTSLGEFAFRDHGPWLRLHRRAVFAVLHSLAAELTDRAFGSPRPCRLCASACAANGGGGPMSPSVRFKTAVVSDTTPPAAGGSGVHGPADTAVACSWASASSHRPRQASHLRRHHCGHGKVCAKVPAPRRPVPFSAAHVQINVVTTHGPPHSSRGESLDKGDP